MYYWDVFVLVLGFVFAFEYLCRKFEHLKLENSYGSKYLSNLPQLAR